MTDLEARIRRLEDRAELEVLVLRYFLAADDDWDTLGACFAPDAQFSAGGSRSGRWRRSS